MSFLSIFGAAILMSRSARRIEAARSLGWNEIPIHVVDLDAIVLGEFDANEIRKGFTVSEKVAIGRAVEEKLGERRGRPRDDVEPASLFQEEKPQNFADYSGRETREVAAERSGFGNAKTYEQAKTVVDRAVPQLRDAVDAGEVSVSAAAEVAKLGRDEQRVVVESGEEAIADATRSLKVSGLMGPRLWAGLA
jgi:ParB family chromosome partitioning protein